MTFEIGHEGQGSRGSNSLALTIAAQLFGAIGPAIKGVAFKSSIDVSGWTLPVVAAEDIVRRGTIPEKRFGAAYPQAGR